MKKVYLSILSLVVCCAINAQVAVTLNVDLNDQTVSANGVHIAGNFGSAGYAEWDPAGISLTDADADGIYSVTLNLPTNSVYQFKFVNGNDWDSSEGGGVPQACRYAGSDNRELVVVGTEPFSKTIVWQGCGPDGENVVRFRVDMSTLPAVNPLGVHVAGNFQDVDGGDQWQAGDNPLYDLDGNGVWEAYYSIGTANSITFKYLNGNQWGNDETVTGSCGNEGNRVENITDENTILPAYCFGQCDPCTQPAAVTFKVDMSLQSEVTSVYIAGTFAAAGYSDWNASGIELTDADEDGIYEVTLNLPGGNTPGTNYRFKFVRNGSNWEEFAGACIVDGNRDLTIIGSDAITYEACFNQCATSCVPDPDPADITFSVNMSNVTMDPAGPRLIGSFTNPAWQGGQVTLQESAVAGIWYATVTVSGSAGISYKFVNGVADSADESNAESNIEACGSPNGIGGFNRTHIRSGNAETLTTPCFDSCEICGTIISVEETDVVNGLLVYPNPVEDLMNISFSNPAAQKITINVFNNMGQQVVAKDLGTISGQRITTLNTANLATGIYTLAISNGTKNQTVRISVR